MAKGFTQYVKCIKKYIGFPCSKESYSWEEVQELLKMCCYLIDEYALKEGN